MGDSWGIQREVTLNDLTSSWAQIDANWKRPSPSVFLQIYSSGTHDKSSRKEVGQRSLSPNLERDTTESGGVDLDPSLDDLLQGATRHVAASDGPRREVITLDDGDDNYDEVGERSGMTKVSRPEFRLSSQDDFMMADILDHETRDDGVLIVGSVPPPSQNERSTEQTHRASSENDSTTKELTVVEHVEPKSMTSDREIPVNPSSHPMDTSPNSIFDFSHDDVPSSQTVQSVEERTSPFSSRHLLPEPSNDSTIPVNNIQVNPTEPPSEPDTTAILIPSHNPPPPPYNPATIISRPANSPPISISRPSSSVYDSHTMFLTQVLARQQTKEDQQQAKAQRKERRDKARARAAARKLMSGNVESDEAPQRVEAVAMVKTLEGGMEEEVVSSNLETVEHEGRGSESTIPMEIEGVVADTELPFEETEDQVVSSLDHPTQPTIPSPAIGMDATANKEVTLSKPEASSETIFQLESPPPTREEIVLDAQVLESSTVKETETHADVVQHNPDSVMDEDESIPTDNMHGVVEMDDVERKEVEESILVLGVEMDLEMSSEKTELVQPEEVVSSNIATDENLLDAPQVEDQVGKMEEITMDRENVKDGNKLQTSPIDSTQSTPPPTTDILGNISTTDDSGQTLSKEDTTSFQQSGNTQNTNPEPLIQPPHLVPTTILSVDPPVTKQQPVSPSVPPGLSESVKRMWRAPIPPLPLPRDLYAVFEPESVSVDIVERRESATPVLISALIPPLPSPGLPHAVVEEEPISVDTVEPNGQSTSLHPISPVSRTQSPFPSEAATPLDKEPSPIPLIPPVIDAQTQTTPLIPSISPSSATKSTDQPPPSQPPRKRSVSVVIPVPPRSQTTSPLPTISPSTSADSTPPSPSRPVKFKVRFNDLPSPPSKRRRVSRSKSESVQPPPAPPAVEREMLDCIVVRNDFENAPKRGVEMEDV